MQASAAWRLRLVVHPLTVASVVLLAANDAWFKAWWPGPVTGKLSDAAGVWMVGVLLVAATGSVRWGAAFVTRPSNSLLATSQLPPAFGRSVFWWTIVAQLPWVFTMVMAGIDRHVNSSAAASDSRD